MTADQANAAIAFCALLVAGLSVYFTYKGIKHQTKHNELSVRPIPLIELADNGGIRVDLTNHGFGPFSINDTKIINGEDGKWNIIDYLPTNPPPSITVRFTTGLKGRSVGVDRNIEILIVEAENGAHDTLSYINQCKINLSRLIFVISYTDMYENKFEDHKKDLSWFVSE